MAPVFIFAYERQVIPMGDILKPAGEWIANHVPLALLIGLLILSLFFKIAKTEINPLGWILGLLGKAMTNDIKKAVLDLKNDTNAQIQSTNASIGKLQNDLDAFEERTKTSISEMKDSTEKNYETLKSRISDMELSNDMQTVRQIKAHVLDFANSCLNHRKHTKKDFDNIIKENEEYESLCEKHHLKNDVYKEDFAYIMKIYHACQDKDNFLRDEDDS